LPDAAAAREPLPTIEVVQPPRRARLLDVRGPLQFGWGYSNLWKTPVYAIAFEVQASVVEITKTTWLHVAFGEDFMIAPYPVRDGERTPGLMGADVGLGLSRYAPGGPGLFVTVTGGPRWTLGRDRIAPDGGGIVGRADVFPFYRSIPELVQMRGQWFRKYVLSSVNLWVSARFDYTPAAHGNTYAGGVGLDVGRTVLLPIIERVVR
jgi:hypothetical protein